MMSYCYGGYIMMSHGEIIEQLHSFVLILIGLTALLPLKGTVYGVDPNDKSCCVVLSGKNGATYPGPGLHFRVPLRDKVTYINLEHTLSDSGKIQIRLDENRKITTNTSITIGLPDAKTVKPNELLKAWDNIWEFWEKQPYKTLHGNRLILDSIDLSKHDDINLNDPKILPLLESKVAQKLEEFLSNRNLVLLAGGHLYKYDTKLMTEQLLSS